MTDSNWAKRTDDSFHRKAVICGRGKWVKTRLLLSQHQKLLLEEENVGFYNTKKCYCVAY